MEAMIRRDRLLMTLVLAILTLLAWIYLVRASAAMSAMASEARMHAAMGMADMRVWGLSDWFDSFVMWAVMMIAMMLPSAAPMILLVLGVYRRRDDSQARLAGLMFLSGYVFAWTAFSAVAAGLQVMLHRTALLAPDMRLTSAALSGILLILVGAYQWLPVKNACLMRCQLPVAFLSAHWREGARGGLMMGSRHGVFCIGCCCLLMTVLFVVGVMNLFWVAALAAVVLLEKLAKRGKMIGRVAGVVAASWGVFLLTRAF